MISKLSIELYLNVPIEMSKCTGANVARSLKVGIKIRINGSTSAKNIPTINTMRRNKTKNQ